MSKTVRGKCKWEGCKRIGAFWGHCKNHFRSVYGISFEEYRANRLRPREDPRQTAARIKGAQATPPGGMTPAPMPTDLGPAFVDSSAPTKQDVHATAVIFPQDLWNRICEVAEKEYRSPDQQVLFMINAHIKGEYLVPVRGEISDNGLKEKIVELVYTDSAIRRALRIS